MHRASNFNSLYKYMYVLIWCTVISYSQGLFCSYVPVCARSSRETVSISVLHLEALQGNPTLKGPNLHPSTQAVDSPPPPSSKQSTLPPSSTSSPKTKILDETLAAKTCYVVVMLLIGKSDSCTCYWTRGE